MQSEKYCFGNILVIVAYDYQFCNALRNRIKRRMNVLKNISVSVAIVMTLCVAVNLHAQTIADVHTQHHQQLLERQPAVYEEINLLDTVAMKELLIPEPWISEAALL